MSNSRAWGIWIAAISVCPLTFYVFAFAFQAHWLPPDRSGWSQLPIGIIFFAHLGLLLVLAVAPPRPARDGWYWPFLGVLLADAWVTMLLTMGLAMATYYE